MTILTHEQKIKIINTALTCYDPNQQALMSTIKSIENNARVATNTIYDEIVKLKDFKIEFVFLKTRVSLTQFFSKMVEEITENTSGTKDVEVNNFYENVSRFITSEIFFVIDLVDFIEANEKNYRRFNGQLIKDKCLELIKQIKAISEILNQLYALAPQEAARVVSEKCPISNYFEHMRSISILIAGREINKEGSASDVNQQLKDEEKETNVKSDKEVNVDKVTDTSPQTAIAPMRKDHLGNLNHMALIFPGAQYFTTTEPTPETEPGGFVTTLDSEEKSVASSFDMENYVRDVLDKITQTYITSMDVLVKYEEAILQSNTSVVENDLIAKCITACEKMYANTVSCVPEKFQIESPLTNTSNHLNYGKIVDTEIDNIGSPVSYIYDLLAKIMKLAGEREYYDAETIANDRKIFVLAIKELTELKETMVSFLLWKERSEGIATE